MLSVKQRQTYLKALGFYSGTVDGDEGPRTKEAYKNLQKTYFTRPKDIDGKYGNNTEIILISAYNLRNSKYFTLKEFKCTCKGKYCTGYPAILDANLANNLEKLRAKYGTIHITSGMRCPTRNKEVGGASGSRHRLGKAVDFNNAYTTTRAKRSAVKRFWMSLPGSRYTYGQDDSAKYKMGNSLHVDVK